MKGKALPAVVNSVLKPVGKFIVKNEPAFLLGGQIGCELAADAVIFRNADKIKSTIADAKVMIAQANSDDQKKDIYKLTFKELTKLIAPIVAFKAGAVACSVRSFKIIKSQGKQIQQLTDSLSAANSAIVSYQLFKKEAEKELSDKKLEKVNNEVTKQMVDQNPPTEDNTGNRPEPKFIEKEGKQVATPMYLYLDGNTPSRYIWTNKSPNDIKAWALQHSAMLYDGDYAMDTPSDAIGINEFYEFLSEDLSTSYVIPAYDRDKNMYWRAEDAGGQKTSDLVNIDIGYADGEDGQAIHSFHCNFFPFR